MNRTTTGLCLAALLVSCSMNGISLAEYSHHWWKNGSNERAGMLTVSGALLSSPCTLETNEVALPLPEQKEGIMMRYALKLNLLGCGDGGAVASATSVAGRDRVMVIQSILLPEERGLQAKQRMVSTGRAVVCGGANQFTYWLNEAQQLALMDHKETGHIQKATDISPWGTPRLLSLRLEYE
ncbi:pilus-assembly fibrillin subunit [Escherichia coli]|uniref:pilus-assembly fibrillin subunit n=1 Tax=Escherichia coli TaxID=562 RepID=UPI00159092DD|nr:pilus-assembly fibrillin subunit [Escherichia coli]